MKYLEQALQTVAQVSLASLPTPLARLSRVEQALHHPGIFIKRDDLTGLGPGGNKLRSLEFVLGEAVEQHADVVIAAGPLQSNLCTLTAAACAKLSLRCILVHNAPEPTHPEGNVLLNSLLGAESHYIGAVSTAQRTMYTEHLALELSGRYRPYIVKNGATSGRGALGYVKAVPELCRQAETLGISDITIYIPGGNGGVASGLIYGNALCGFPFRTVVVSVEHDAQTLSANIRRTIAEIEPLLHLSFPCHLETACTITDQYRGGGWGVNTNESRCMISDFARTEGILIENIYNSKVLVGTFDDICSGRVSGSVCFLHTGGFGSLFAQF